MLPLPEAATPACLRTLVLMDAAARAGRHEEAEIVCEGIHCWIGARRVHRSTVHRLLAMLAVTDTSDGAGVKRYVLTDTGRAIQRRPALVAEIAAALAAKRAFTIRGDQVTSLD